MPFLSKPTHQFVQPLVRFLCKKNKKSIKMNGKNKQVMIGREDGGETVIVSVGGGVGDVGGCAGGRV